DFLEQLPLTQVRPRRPALGQASLAALQELLLPTRDRLLARLAAASSLDDRHLATDDCKDEPELVFNRENRRTCQRKLPSRGARHYPHARIREAGQHQTSTANTHP